MKRRMVFFTSVGALHLVACGGEPIETGEEYGEARQALSITPSLLIRGFRYSGTTEGSLIKLAVSVASELYVGTISLAKGGPAEATTGTFAQGSATRPGFADVTISGELYDSILADVKVSKLTIELEYDPNKGTVHNVFIEYV